MRSKGAQAFPKLLKLPKFLMPYPNARKPSLNSLNSLISLSPNTKKIGIKILSFTKNYYL